MQEFHDFRVPLTPENPGDDVTLYLQVGPAGDGTDSDVVRWRQPRVERAGRQTILLKNVRRLTDCFDSFRAETLLRTSEHLAAACDVHHSGLAAVSSADVQKSAAEHHVDPELLTIWLSSLGLRGGETAIADHVHIPYQHDEHLSIGGWTFPEAPALSILSNPSDDIVPIPGKMQP